MTTDKKTSRGGARAGAGRPTGSGKYGEKAYLVRLPGSIIKKIEEIFGIQVKVYAQCDKKKNKGHIA